MSSVINLDIWKKHLEKNHFGEYITNLANISLALRTAPEFRGKFGKNEFSHTLMVLGELPWGEFKDPRPIEDSDPIKLQEWLQNNGINVNAKNTVIDAMQSVASENPFNPLQDNLKDLEWDLTPRIDTWLVVYLNAEDKPFVRAVSRKFLISAVARAMNPGCKVDTMLVLEGEQGIGKSQTLQALGEPWVLEELSDMKSKDCKQEIQGHWLVEVSELDAMKRNVIETVKAFIAKQVDTFRPSYGRYAKEHPRQCVLVGTTNSDAYLRDHTGNRRFWPVSCGKADLVALRQNRDQLWAEAVTAYRNDEQWWLEEDETALAREEQAERFEHDVWQDTVNDYLSNTTKSKITGLDIMEHCLYLDRSQQTVVTGRRISQIMEQAGWLRTGRRLNRKDKDGEKRKFYEWKNPQNDYPWKQKEGTDTDE
jgi:putative DNA primase/helicase